MEEYVAERVEETYNQLNKRRPEWLKCDCESCRLDVTSYVLNKVHPHYIVSGRGAVYTAQTLIDKQLSADVDALVLDGIRRVATNLRPDHKVIAVQTILGDKEAESPAFNFPVITGTVLNGATFEPLANACWNSRTVPDWLQCRIRHGQTRPQHSNLLTGYFLSGQNQ